MAKIKKAQDGINSKATSSRTMSQTFSGKNMPGGDYSDTYKLANAKVKYKTSDKNYVTKSKTDASGNVTSSKSRRTLKGLLSGAPSLRRNLKSGGKVMLKRKDGSTSQRGLWDNIRAAAKRNKAAGKPGKRPTAAMLKQERKIKSQSKKKK